MDENESTSGAQVSAPAEATVSASLSTKMIAIGTALALVPYLLMWAAFFFLTHGEQVMGEATVLLVTSISFFLSGAVLAFSKQVKILREPATMVAISIVILTVLERLRPDGPRFNKTYIIIAVSCSVAAFIGVVLGGRSGRFWRATHK